ncbi:hypothetical protein [Candidatus Accumulibacter sp. ACC003]|uniref:hypothetical protein n=1 Tax=Candidatus Accumulibacter sp. ACC003 TaxID=2823334 RepID=UPI0025C391F7|nr:hypothetical protein [Candidatus Accumulibacter sp. ACC003]
MRALAITLGCAVIVGCASVDPYQPPPVAQRLQLDDALGDCARLFQASDALIDAAGTRDAQAPRLAGFPHLRVDRSLALLATSADVANDAPRANEWTAALAALDDSARRIELRNAGQHDAEAAAALAACRRLLARADRQQLAALLAAAQVADDYSTTQRALGLYTLTRYAFAAGIRRWQRDTLADFAAAAGASGRASLPQVAYSPAAPLGALPRLPLAPQLGLPPIPPERLAALLVRHAPRLLIATADDNDRPGALAWQSDNGALRIGIAVEQPVLYARAAYTRMGGRWLLQLVYSAWFSARPPAHALDVVAGRLDGLLWRVTLADDGAPLVYDSIHPCGCYHLFIPTERARARPQPETMDEGAFVPQSVRAPAADERVVLHLASGTHYLQRVDIAPAGGDDGVRLALLDDDQLRALPLPAGGTRSAFGPDGLIAGSERAERFYFWPMGIASAGQMRQWGRHATAFVGRRHFDDPTLIDRSFERLP